MHNPHAHQPLHLPFRTRPPPKLDQQPEHARERMLVRLADAHQLVALGCISCGVWKTTGAAAAKRA